MRQRLSDLTDTAAIAAVGSGLGVRFGWWLAAVVVGVIVMAANFARYTK